MYKHFILCINFISNVSIWVCYPIPSNVVIFVVMFIVFVIQHVLGNGAVRKS